jgi:hypothetical protein
MKALLMSSLLLLFLFSIGLIGNQGNPHVLDKTRRQAANVLPKERMKWIEAKAATYTGQVFRFVPPQMRQKAMSKAWAGVELVIFRGLLLWHMLPVFSLPVLIGFLEGLNARQNQQALVKIHSPVWFRAALLGLALVPLIVSLWLVVPIVVPANLVVLLAFVMSTLAWRNLVVHAPSHF